MVEYYYVTKVIYKDYLVYKLEKAYVAYELKWCFIIDIFIDHVSTTKMLSVLGTFDNSSSCTCNTIHVHSSKVDYNLFSVSITCCFIEYNAENKWFKNYSIIFKLIVKLCNHVVFNSLINNSCSKNIMHP